MSLQMDLLFYCFCIISIIFLYLCKNLWRSYDNSLRVKQSYVSVMVVLGSGGHTAEMMALLKGLKLGLKNKKYFPITFLTAKTDEISKQKAIQWVKTEALNEEDLNCELLYITRSRSVGQSYWTSIVTTFISFVESISIISKVKPELIICNGPAICFPICFLAKLMLRNVCIVFIESFCRTESLSMTGKLIYYLRIFDHFLVEWPQLTLKYKRSKYIGLIV